MSTKVTKSKANYRPAESDQFECGNCIHFQPVNSAKTYGYCELVIGRVANVGVCDLWEPNPLMEPGDKVYEMHKRNVASAVRTKMRKV